MNKENVLDLIEEKLNDFKQDVASHYVEPYAIFCDMRTYAEIYEKASDPYYLVLNGKKLKLLTEHPKNGLIKFEILYKLK